MASIALARARELMEEDEDEEMLTELLNLRPPWHRGDSVKHGGSVAGRAPNKKRDCHARHARLMKQYFDEDSIYNATDFRRRYRMSHRLFDVIHDGVVQADDYFVQKQDAAGRVGISSHLKVTAALRVLAYASASDAIDENLEISESTVRVCVEKFCKAIISEFGAEYLRSPNDDELRQLLAENGRRGFVGMIGSIDCMHWAWKNCPVYLAGQHKGKEPKPTKVLEAVSDYKLRIWHCNFGSPGSLNDLNILEQSPIFNDILQGKNANVQYTINGREYRTPYLLADGIYPNWPAFVKSIERPLGKKRQHFARVQESCRKDVERCFGVLQARWRVLDTPCRLWNANAMETVMIACIIMHNMIIEDESRNGGVADHSFLFMDENQPGGAPAFVVSRPSALRASTPNTTVAELIVRTAQLRDRQKSFELQADLVEHLWTLHGDI